MNTLIEREAMKFIINGRSFDTATSETAAVSRGVLDAANHELFTMGYGSADEVRYDHTLYRTAKGAFFLHCHSTSKFRHGKPVTEDSATELTPEEALKWIERDKAMILDPTGLDLPEEA